VVVFVIQGVNVSVGRFFVAVLGNEGSNVFVHRHTVGVFVAIPMFKLQAEGIPSRIAMKNNIIHKELIT
jgi:hypothetical protein